MSHSLTQHAKIVRGKKTILEAIQEQKTQIQRIRPPDPKLQTSYLQDVEQLGKDRGIPLWYPYLGSGIGRGPLVQLQDGSVKYDLIGGIGVHHFGHSHPQLLSAAIDGAISDIAMQGNLQQNKNSAELIRLLVDRSGLDHCFLTTSGSMANENALKLAFQKRYPAYRVLAFERGFAGRSLGMCHITEKPEVREGIPATLRVDYVPFFNASEPEESTKRTLQTLDRYLMRYPGEYAAMLLELIQGEGGFYPGEKKFFQAIGERLKKDQVAFIADEVQTFGRTSHLFAFQHFELQEIVDIVSIGKLSQVCATLFTEEYRPKPGLLSQTFTGSSSAISVSKTLIQLMLDENFFGPEGKNKWVEATFQKEFEKIRATLPNAISGPYGTGAMVAFTPFDGDPKRALQLTHTLFEKGVISFICGKHPTRVRFLVPVGAIEEKDIVSVCAILKEALLCS